MAAPTAWKVLWLIAGAVIGYLALTQWPQDRHVEQDAEATTPAAPATALPRVTRFRPNQEQIAGIASVIDGDTIEIHGQRIRLWGIDAPEGHQLCYVNGKPWRCGQQAALALSDHLVGHVTCRERDRDRYQRVVAVCETMQTSDLSEWMVSRGWALDWPRHSQGAYSYAQGQAKFHRRGMWQGEFDKPWQWRREN